MRLERDSAPGYRYDSFNQLKHEVIDIVESQFNRPSFSREINVGEV